MGDEAFQENTLFKPTSWQKKIDFINRLTLKNNVLISVLAKDKSGKTTFANLLQASLSPKIKGYNITAHSIFNPRIFLQQIGATLNIPGEPSFSNFISYINEKKIKILLVIDDAHFLSLEFIEAILNSLKNQGDDTCFHVCLIADHTLLLKLKPLATNKYVDMVHTIDLGPLTVSETKSYLVEQLLRISGIDRLINEDKLKQFYSLTEGCLLQMNQQFTNFFSGLEKINIKSIHHDKTLRHAAAGVGLLLAAFVIGVFYKKPATNIETTLKEPQVLITLEALDLPISSFVPAYFDMAKQHSLAPIMVKEEVLASVIPIINKGLLAPKEIVHKASINTPKHIKLEGYTIQLMGSYNQASLEKFSVQHQIKGKIWAIHKKGNKTWYVFTVGQYKETNSAHLAINKLPHNVSQLRPWVRSIENNMQEIS